STLTINLTVRGNEPPVIVTEASDKTVECDGEGNLSELTAWLESIGETGVASAKFGEVTWTNNFKELSDLCGKTGSAAVVFTATDECGNSVETSATFTIEDKTAPIINCPANITVDIDINTPDAIVNIPQPVISDACGNVTFINDYNNTADASGVYPIGLTTVVYTATDECGNTSTCEFTVNVLCEGKTRISGNVFDNDNNSPQNKVMVMLIPQAGTLGDPVISVTNSKGEYAFTGMVPGDYLVQVQDANLNVKGLYPVESSLFFTKIEDCVFQKHDFAYEKSDLVALGDLVWYDVNSNGLQDEWFDANNDGIVTENIPDYSNNGYVDFKLWEWIDMNGDGSYSGPENEGELNKAGIGNALNPNIKVTGPNGFNEDVIIGFVGYWRTRTIAGSWGTYEATLNYDENLGANAKDMGETKLVKELPKSEKSKNLISLNTGISIESNVTCGVTTENPLTAIISAETPVNLDLDFGIICEEQLEEMILADDQDSTSMNKAVTVFVQNNDSNIPEGSQLTAPTNTTIGGTILINANGSVTYTPPTDYIGEDTFDYVITAPDGRIDTAKVTITVLVPEDIMITATDDEFEIFNDQQAFGNIIANDFNNYGEIVINITPVTTPDSGTVVINPDGTIIYTPVDGFSGVDSFSYQICNSIVPNFCDIAVVKIYVSDADTTDDFPATPCELFIPNGFSPNNDNINDYFELSLYNETNDCKETFGVKYPDARVEIFNRWGNKVFEKDNFGNTDRWGNVSLAWWDGRSNTGLTIGNDYLPAGTYFYIVYFNDGSSEPKAGSVFLNR
ncbi:MAG: gliding motility-associated C-terminal domain-containing protein, partial [Prolixibacteraceae bacterium]|nr:gliding motility-associated C-terminal domain-containing protein [Prolixibacteraceae bacterium]